MANQEKKVTPISLPAIREIRTMAVTALMMAVTLVVVKLAVIVHMTLHLMDLNAVIQQQQSMV